MNVLTSYENSLKLGQKSANTIRSYMKDVKKLLNFFNISTIEEVNALSKMQIESFYASQSELDATSLKGLVRNMMAFFHWIDDEENHPFFKVKFGGNRYPKDVQEPKEALTDEECVALIQAGNNAQERFMIALMLFTAIRRGAASKIKLTDINRDECSIIVHEKGDKIRKTFMNETICTMLSVYMAQRNSESEYLFYATRGEVSENGSISGETINKRIQAAAKRAGITKEITAHYTRATRITQIIQAKGIQAAQLVAGHANINTTKLYDGSGEAYVRDILLGK